MREIKFRGKRLGNGEWVCGHHAKDMNYVGTDQFEYIDCIIDRSKGPSEGMWFEVDPKTIGQFTGLHDKNGKEIYEGDYLRCKKYIGGNFVEHCYELGYVEYVHGAFGLHRKHGFYRPFKDWLEDYDIEIIGNVHENPELVNESQ